MEFLTIKACLWTYLLHSPLFGQLPYRVILTALQALGKSSTLGPLPTQPLTGIKMQMVIIFGKTHAKYAFSNNKYL